ncbi:hypothetical protein HOF40_00150 [Candidatus Parcubacteria bacterium]|nr:hypothetical protein [Candidatus Parcubacteria bacterium]
MIRKVTQLLFLTAFALLLFSPAIAEAGSCCYYWTDHPDAVVGTSHHLGCDFYNTDLAIEAVYSCEIPSANEILCWQELAGVLTPSQPCPDEGDDNITATGYANMFGATWEDDGSCLTLSDESGGNYYKDSYSGSGAQASCSELATENNDPNFQARLDIAEGLVVVTGVHMAKCVCWDGPASGSKTCSYGDVQLDFDATVQTEAEFQVEYAAKCAALSSGLKKCDRIDGYIKETSPAELVELMAGDTCDIESVVEQDAPGEVIDRNKKGVSTEPIDPIAALRGDIKKLNKLGTDDINIVFANIIKAGLGVLGSLALVMIVYGGALWMTAAGNAEREKKGLQVLIWAGLGVVIIFASYAILDFVFDIFSDF